MRIGCVAGTVDLHFPTSQASVGWASAARPGPPSPSLTAATWAPKCQIDRSAARVARRTRTGATRLDRARGVPRQAGGQPAGGGWWTPAPLV